MSKLSACDVNLEELETKTVRAEDLKVGDIILVKDDEIVPADCFILASGSSLEQTDGNINPGQCFISTGNLDGERNLKPKMAIKEVEANLGAIVSGQGRDLVIEVNCKDGPILDLYKFDSTLKIVTADKQLPVQDCDLKQFAPRGSHVRNSKHLYLMVLFTGNDTKLILNQGHYRFKRSRIENMLNVVLTWNTLVLAGIIVLMTILNYQFTTENYDKMSYIFKKGWYSEERLAIDTAGSMFLLNVSWLPLDLAAGL